MVEQFKSQALSNEERVAKINRRKDELSKKVKDMESKLTENGVTEERIASFFSKYKEDLENESSRVKELEDHLSHEQQKSANLESKVENIQKKADVDADYTCELVGYIADLEKLFNVAENEGDHCYFENGTAVEKLEAAENEGDRLLQEKTRLVEIIKSIIAKMSYAISKTKEKDKLAQNKTNEVDTFTLFKGPHTDFELREKIDIEKRLSEELQFLEVKVTEAHDLSLKLEAGILRSDSHTNAYEIDSLSQCIVPESDVYDNEFDIDDLVGS